MQCAHCATPVPNDARFCHSCGSLVSDAEGAARASGAMTQESFDKIEELLRQETEGDYTVDRLLGKGGMAVVYLAHEVHLARNVAIKVLPPELTFGHGVERFKREAKTAAALDHPNIIPIYRISSGGTLFWYAMKYLEGQSLEQMLKERGRLPLAEAVAILRQIADALDYAHEHQVVHRDMKPANVMLDKRQRVIVTDFGIAKALTEGTLTASGSIIGTPYFMSPEQGMGKPVTGASDQYSVGVMAYRMLSGHVPFEGDSAIDVLHKHCMVPPPALEINLPGMPRHVYLAVHRALDKKPDQRFPTVSDMVDALEGRGSVAVSASAAVPGQADATVAAPSATAADLATTPMPSLAHSMPGVAREDVTLATPAPAQPPPRPHPTPVPPPKRKRSVMPVLAAAVVVVGGAIGAYFASRQSVPRVEAARPDTVAQAPQPGPAAAVPTTPDTAAPARPAVESPPPEAVAESRQTPPAQEAPPPVRTPPAAAPPVQQRPAAPAPTTGTLEIRGLPAGSVVSLPNRVLRGQNAVTLPAGRYPVEIVAGGYEPQRQTVTIRAGVTTVLDFAAQRQAAPAAAAPPSPAPAPEVGILLLAVQPAAEIFVNGLSRGQQIMRLTDTVLVGSVQIRLVPVDGSYRDSTFVYRVAAGRNTPLRVVLQKK